MKGTDSIILGLDVSSSCTGYAVLKKGRWRKSHSCYGKIELGSRLPISEKLSEFRKELFLLFDNVRPNKIIIEDVFSGRNVKTMKLLARFSGVAMEASHSYLSSPPTLALTAEVRSFLECGRTKEEAFEYICSRYNLDWEFKKMNDVADAIALVLFEHARLKESIT